MLTDSPQILNPQKADTPAQLVLRPGDFMARPIHSSSCPSNNVLLRVTVPKRTGRKRKRGSDAPFVDVETEGAVEQPRRWKAKDMLRRLRDNPSKYTVDTIGRVERTHYFRGTSYLLARYSPHDEADNAIAGLPDFVYSTTSSAFTKRFRECIVPYDREYIPHRPRS